MRVLPLSALKAKLSELVDDAIHTHEQSPSPVTAHPPRSSSPPRRWDALNESLYWHSQPGITDDIATARAEHALGDTLDEATIRAR